MSEAEGGGTERPAVVTRAAREYPVPCSGSPTRPPASRLMQTRIRAPTLVLQGRADTVVDSRNAHLLAERIPEAELVTFPALGHLMFWEDPDGFADKVASFLLAGTEPDQARAAAAARSTRRDRRLRFAGPSALGSPPVTDG